jgi:epoxyqueuosine reductase
MSAADGGDLVATLQAIGIEAGLTAVGVCAARAWDHTRSTLESRRAEGLHGGMNFTYRKPARSADPSRILRNARSLVVGAWPYAQRPPDPSAADGKVPARVARYATEDHYAHLDAALGHIADHLRSLGHRAVVVSDDNALVDREAAWRAGIGSAGKNANVLLPGHGSWFVLGAVVTDAPLPTTGPPVGDQCGSCHRCLDACPTDAIVAPGVVDARRCLAWLLQQPGSFPHEHRAALGDRIYGCDDCQEVCPPSRREEAHAPEGTPSTWLDAIELLALDDAELLDRCGRWYIPGRDVSVVRRNLLVVVGNSGRGDDPAVVATLDRYAASGDPVLAEHARWALERLALDGPADGGHDPARRDRALGANGAARLEPSARTGEDGQA